MFVCTRKLAFVFVLSGLIGVWCQTNSTENSANCAIPEIITNQFSLMSRCPGRVLDSAHIYHTATVRSVLDCVGQCHPKSGCLSVRMDKVKRECHLANATVAIDCHNTEVADRNLTQYEATIPCPTYGEALGPFGTCVCDEGFRGTPCQPYIADCTEGFARGNFTTDGVYEVFPLAAPEPFQVYCKSKANNDRTYIMERFNSNKDYNKNFNKYVDGFGNIDGDFFLGLEKIHYLTSSKDYELRIFVQIYNGSRYFQQYQNFVVTDSASGYRLQFSSTKDDTLLGDCLSPLLGAKFSTSDNDNDEDPTVNCALKHGSGFWFRGPACSTCNPTGLLTVPTNGLRSGVDHEAFWTDDLGDLAPYEICMYLVTM